MIKLYAWQKVFQDVITSIRLNEYALTKYVMKLAVFTISGLYLFPLLLQSVTFTAYIGFGGTLNL